MSDYNNENIYSKRLRAGKRRTYFFDVRTTKNNDYFVTLTESKKRYDGEGYDRHKIFLYKEDFNKFIDALTETIMHVKTDLMPDFDFDAFRHEDDEDNYSSGTLNTPSEENPSAAPEAVPDHPYDSTSEIADELNSTPKEASHTHPNTENPTANDDAETW